jgi:hypothetical protein
MRKETDRALATRLLTRAEIARCHERSARRFGGERDPAAIVWRRRARRLELAAWIVVAGDIVAGVAFVVVVVVALAFVAWTLGTIGAEAIGGAR